MEKTTILYWVVVFLFDYIMGRYIKKSKKNRTYVFKGKGLLDMIQEQLDMEEKYRKENPLKPDEVYLINIGIIKKVKTYKND